MLSRRDIIVIGLIVIFLEFFMFVYISGGMKFEFVYKIMYLLFFIYGKCFFFVD